MKEERKGSRAKTDTDADREASGRLDSLKAEMDRVASGAALALEVAGLKTPTRPLGKKSMLLSGLLSFFLGPFGWLYAAPLKEAIPTIVVYCALGSLLQWILPSFLLMYIVGIANVLTAVAGVLYAWGFNSAGKRVPLVLKEGAEGASLRKLLSRK